MRQDGPRGRATLGLPPTPLLRVVPGKADPGLFHTAPAPLLRVVPGKTDPGLFHTAPAPL